MEPADQEERVAAEKAQAESAALAELEAAVDSGEYKEPIDMLGWIKSQAETPINIKLAIEKQLAWYKLSDEEESEEDGDERLAREDASTRDESDNMDDAARERMARGERA